jgi:hypothetical protein
MTAGSKKQSDGIARAGMGVVVAMALMGVAAVCFISFNGQSGISPSYLIELVDERHEFILGHAFMLFSSLVLSASLLEYKPYHTWFQRAWRIQQRQTAPVGADFQLAYEIKFKQSSETRDYLKGGFWGFVFSLAFLCFILGILCSRSPPEHVSTAN